jgi:large subunit ribosomal protein L21
MFAIVEIAGRQYTVSPNDTIVVPTLAGKGGASVTFDRVLLLGDEKKITVGNPLVKGASVQATVLDHGKGDKVVVFKKKKRKGYRVLRGHRQPHTTVQITTIGS